jgi:hypothetical protein
MEHEKVIDALNSEIEPMSQETADALIDAFQKFNENMGVTQETLANFNKVINQEMARQAVDKFLGYVEKFTCATFLTRWYWKRKAFDAAQTVKMVSEFLNNCE